MGMPASDSQRWIIGICATCSVKCCFSKQQLASECSLIFSYVSDWSIASPMLESMMPVQKVLWLFRDDLALFPNVNRRAIHPRSFLRVLCCAAQGTPHTSGKARRSGWLRSRFRLHQPFSNSCGARPELSYTAQLSANER